MIETLSPLELFAEIRFAAGKAADKKKAADNATSDDVVDDAWAAFGEANDALFALVWQAEERGLMSDLQAYLTVSYGR